MRTALVYDRVNKYGGAEVVLMALHEIFPDAPLFTSVYDPLKATWAKVFPEVITTFLQKIPLAKSRHEYLGSLTPLAFEDLKFDDYDLVISVTSEAAKGIITKPETLHICYLLTPTRYLWSHYDTYFKNPLLRTVSLPLVNYLKVWDKVASRRPDHIISISNEVKDRVDKYYGRSSRVIFPPVDVERFSNKEEKKEDFYLVLGRMVPYKRADLALSAFSKNGLKLKVAGTGSQENYLRSKFTKFKNIEFLGYVEDKKVTELFLKAKGFVFPGEEDFGIVMVEALAAGTPVIAFNKGGARDIVTDGKSGVLFDKQDADSLLNAVKRFEQISFNKKTLIEESGKFSKAIFKKDFIRYITNIHTVKNG